MSTIHAVLLIPAEGDPLGLLREGRHGAKPPVATFRAAPEYRVALGWIPGPFAGSRQALVFRWGGERVSAGLFHAWYHADDIGTDALADVLYGEDVSDLVETIGAWRRDGKPLGTLVLVDAEGHEIND